MGILCFWGLNIGALKRLQRGVKTDMLKEMENSEKDAVLEVADLQQKPLPREVVKIL